MASRVRSLVGRISRPAGASSRRPRRSPPTSSMLTRRCPVPGCPFRDRSSTSGSSTRRFASRRRPRPIRPAATTRLHRVKGGCMPGLRPGLRLRRSHVRFRRLIAPVREELRDLIVQHPLRHLLDLAAFQLAQLEGAIGDPDQPIDRQPMLSITLRTSRFLPSRSVMVSQALAPCWRSSTASIGPYWMPSMATPRASPTSRLGSTKPFTRTR